MAHVRVDVEGRDKSSTYIQVSAGSYHTCALTSKGGYECVGRNNNGEAPSQSQNRHCPAGSESTNGLCQLCLRNEISNGGYDGKKCVECTGGSHPSNERNRCMFPFIEDEIKRMKEEQNDLSIKNSRLWAKEEVRMTHDELMAKRKDKDNKNERDYCKREEEEGTVVFPAIDVPNEIEKVEDTTCIDTNRDELLKAFCSFSTKLDTLLTIQGSKKSAQSFFPNICCKERRDTKLEVCKDPSGKLARENIIPFALSQGGHYSRHNLYAEVSDALKTKGYLHKGMLNVLDEIKAKGKEMLKHRINGFFEEISLCGPRVVDEPGTRGERQLCQLFVPYGHVLNYFYNGLKTLYEKPVPLLELSERSRLGKAMLQRQQKVGETLPVQQLMKNKQKKAPQKCKAGPTFGPTELANKKKLFCKGINHIDLMNPTIKNVALYYLRKDLPSEWTNQNIFDVEDHLRYKVEDKSGCPSKLFGAEDISIQQVAMNTDVSKKDWAAVIKLNTGEGGYLKSEMPKCEHAHYLPRNDMTVNVFEDKHDCCQGSKDAEKCESGCKLTPLLNKHSKVLSKEVTVTGTVYEVKDSASRRRRLLQRGENSNCRL
eukprot:g2509.t1